MGAPVRLQKAVPGSKENAAVERREVNAHRTGRAPQGVSMLPAPFGAPLPSRCDGAFPLVSEGMGNPGAPRALRKQGGEALAFYCWSVGCLKCESEIDAQDSHAALPAAVLTWLCAKPATPA